MTGETGAFDQDIVRPSASPEELARLVFLSYRFSQGGVGTQNRMLLYIESEHHPDLFDEVHVERVRRLAQEMIGPYFLNQITHPATAIPWEDDRPEAAVKTQVLVENELTGLFERFRDRAQIDGFDHSLTGIAQSVIAMDYDYLTRPNGRAGDSEPLKIKTSPYKRDPYDSVFLRHAVLGDPTRAEEFDDIFVRIGAEDVVTQLDENTLHLLLDVIDIYTSRHDEDSRGQKIIDLRKVCLEGLYGKR